MWRAASCDLITTFVCMNIVPGCCFLQGYMTIQ